MARKITALIAGAGATVLMLSACGGGSGSSTANGSGDAAKNVTSIKLVAAEYSKDHTAAFWKQFAEKYKAKTGITLNLGHGYTGRSDGRASSAGARRGSPASGSGACSAPSSSAASSSP